MSKIIREWFNFIVVFGVIALSIYSLAPAVLPDYERYKAGEYRESVDCDSNAVVCWFKQLEYKETK